MSRLSSARLPLASRLTAVSLRTAAVALLVAGLLLNAAMAWIQHRALHDEASAQARVIADNAVAALMFRDRIAAAETLRTLERAPRVQQAVLFDLDGHVFARFERRTPGRAGTLHVEEVARTGANELGRLELEVSLADLWLMVVAFGAITLGAAVLATFLGWWLARRLRHEVAEMEERLDRLAHHDPVTGLFNRHAAAELLRTMVDSARQSGRRLAIVCFDLDDFKAINDTLGHHVGDGVLRAVAARLRTSAPRGAVGFRFGGDEFVLACPECPGLEDAASWGDLIRRILGGTQRVEDVEVTLTGSVGIARFPHDGDTAEELLRAGDMAMYQAKAGGKNAVALYDPAMAAGRQAELRIESDLRVALREHQFFLVFQPIVEIGSGRIVAAEALLRWRHPERGLIQPQAFIPVAERTGQVVAIGAWVLEEAARTAAQWRRRGLAGVNIAVNVSARQLRRGALLDQVVAAARAAQVPTPELGLEIELTEHTLVEDLVENLQLLESVRAAGVPIAVDDFGTGLSSLSYLKRLPIDKIKIDRSFVDGLPEDASDLAIMGAALSMARALGLRTVAEGVETREQLAALEAMGCDLAQGWLFGRPMPAEDLLEIAMAGTAATDQGGATRPRATATEDA